MDLVRYAAKIGDKSEPTVKNWLKQCEKYGTIYGIVYEKHPHETYLYAKKCEAIIYKGEEKIKQEIEKEIKKKQELIYEKKEEMGNAFEYWIRYEIKNKLYRRMTKTFPHKSPNSHYFGKYYFGESKRIVVAKRIAETISKGLEEKSFEKRMINGKEFDEKKFLEDEHDYFMDYLEMEDDIIFMDAILSHPDKEILKLAWKWFVSYEDKIEIQEEKSGIMGSIKFPSL